MASTNVLTRRLESVFEPRQASVLAEVITDAYDNLVKTSDFNELKEIVRSLAVAQERTEARMTDLAEAQQHLAEAQQRTEVRLTELAEAQQRTDARLANFEQRTDARFAELAAALTTLTTRVDGLGQRVDGLGQRVDGLGQEVGGLSRSVSYSLENEAYRSLPGLLARKYGITLRDSIVRQEINGEEINLFAHGERDGEPVILVGETKLQLDERRNNRRAAERVFAQLDQKLTAVQASFPEIELIPLLITHYARPSFLAQAQERGIIVIQSFEW